MNRSVIWAALVATLVSLGALPRSAVARDPLPVVGGIDFERYAGKWYEIARLPNFFQRKCTGNVTAEYGLRNDGLIRVYNRCAFEGGRVGDVEGVARPVDPKGPNSKLEVSFMPKALRWVPFTWGDYWVVELAEDYRHAVVGTPNRGYLWILARSPQMDADTYDAILRRVAVLGFDTSLVTRTTHDAAQQGSATEGGPHPVFAGYRVTNNAWRILAK